MSRVRLSQTEFEFLKKRQASTNDRAFKPVVRARKRKEDLPENQLERQICDFLRARGWVLNRNHVGTFTPYRVLMALGQKTITLEQAKRQIVRTGERGMADWRAERYWPDIAWRGLAHHVMYFECKAPHKVPTPEQLAWLERKRLCGTPAEWFSDYGKFVEWYGQMFGGK